MYRKTSNLSSREIKKLRGGERRDCAKYDSCLTVAAIADSVCVPCKGCKGFRHPQEHTIMVLFSVYPESP